MFGGCISYVLGVVNPCVRGLYFLRLGDVNPFVCWLYFLTLGVVNAFIWGL